jgi:hypothetical protein
VDRRTNKREGRENGTMYKKNNATGGVRVCKANSIIQAVKYLYLR